MSKRNRNEIWHNRPTAHISCLYPEILALIFGYLDVKDKGSAAQVCSSWRDACYHKSVWKGVEAKIHLRECYRCDPQEKCEFISEKSRKIEEKPRRIESCSAHKPLFQSLVRRGIKKIQVCSRKQIYK